MIGGSMAFSLPVGPQHPIHPEATLIKLKVEGEQVVDADIDASYVHRGIEKAFEYKTYAQGLYLAERICGICNVAHTTCYAINIEELAGIEVPPRARYLRLIVEELARIHSHLLWLGLLAHLIGFESLFMLIFRDRELVMDLIEAVGGNRVTPAYNVIGGVRRDIDEALAYKIREALGRLRERVKRYRKVAMEDPTLRARTVGVGYLSPSEARELLAVGPVARASGIKYDVRADDPYIAHAEVPFNVVVYDTCDTWGRMMVRFDEVLESVGMVLYALDHSPSGDFRVKVPPIFKPPPGENVARVEAPRGELLHYVMSDGSEKPYRYKVRTPTLANLMAVREMLRSRGDRIVYVADVPVVFGSIDPCICCTARVLIVDERGRARETTTDELAKARR
jgi:NADH-quinone oxidoreductase subunit D